MKTKLILASAVSCLFLTACGVVPNMNPFTGKSAVTGKGPADVAARYELLQTVPECPPVECCVAVTGTSHITIAGVEYNFEINTAAGRTNSVFIGPPGNPTFQEFFTIISSECFDDPNSDNLAARVEIDTDGDLTTVEGVFFLTGTSPGNSGNTLTNNMTAELTANAGFPFGSFENATVETGQVIQPDENCDGNPNAPTNGVE